MLDPIQYHPGELIEDLVGNCCKGFEFGYKLGEVIEGKKTIGQAFGKKKKRNTWSYDPHEKEESTHDVIKTSTSCEVYEVNNYTFLNTLKGSRFINGNLKKILKKKEKNGFFLKSLEINDTWDEIRITTISKIEGVQVDTYKLEIDD